MSTSTTEQQQQQGFTLTTEQQHAVDSLIKWVATDNVDYFDTPGKKGFSEILLTGPAGVGKSTIIRSFLKSPEMVDRNFIVCATTNQAAVTLAKGLIAGDSNSEPTPDSVMTVHRAISMRRASNSHGDEVYLPPLNRDYSLLRKIQPDVLLIDEASMIDQVVYGELIAQAYPGLSIIYIGDEFQLPPVGMEVSPAMKVKDHLIRLNTVMRHGGPILALCSALREHPKMTTAVLPPITSFVPAAVATATADSKRGIYMHSVLEFFDAFGETIRNDEQGSFVALAATYKGDGGVDQMNEYGHAVRYGVTDTPFVRGEIFIANKPCGNLRNNARGEVLDIYEPEDDDALILDGMGIRGLPEEQHLPAWKIFYKNLHSGEHSWFWHLKDVAEDGPALDYYQKRLRRAGLEDEADALRRRTAQIKGCYAMTVHKAQGGTYRKVFISAQLDDPRRYGSARQNNALKYTACSRAVEELHLVDPSRT